MAQGKRGGGFYLPLYGSKLGSEINMKEAQTRDVRVSSKGQGGWEKKERAVDARCRKAFSWGLWVTHLAYDALTTRPSETSFLPLSILRNQVLVTTRTSILLVNSRLQLGT